MPYHALVVVMSSGPASCARDEYNKMSSLGRQLMCLDAAFFKISQIGYLETKLGQSRIWLHLDGSWVAVGVKYAHQAFNNALTPYMVGWLAGTFPSRDMLCAIQKLWSSSGNSAGGGLASTRNAVENWYQYHALSLEKLEHCKATHAQKISFRLAHFISYDRFTLQLLRTAGPHTFLLHSSTYMKIIIGS